MKKHIGLLVLVAVASISQAEVLTMTGWADNVVDGPVDSATESFEYAGTNATFTLTITCGAGTLVATSTNNLVVDDGVGNPGRIEAPETPMTIQLSVAVDPGYQLDSLALDYLRVGSWDGGTSADWTQTAGGLSQVVSYPSGATQYVNFSGTTSGPDPITTTLSSLTALSAGNVGGAGDGTWDLSYTVTNDTGTFTGIQQHIAVEYTTSAAALVMGDQGFTIDETAAVDTVVGTLVTAGAQGPVGFSILSGNDGGAFSLGSSTGELKVANPLDYAPCRVTRWSSRRTTASTRPRRR